MKSLLTKLTQLLFAGALPMLMFAAATGSVPAQAPSPTPANPNDWRTIDPMAPGLSQEERYQRNRLKIQGMINERRQREEAERLAAEARKAQEAAGQTPQPTQPTTTMPTQPPGAPQPPGTLAAPGGQAGVQPAATTGKDQEKSGLAIPEAAQVPAMTFYLTPASFNVLPGERFATHSRLLNPKNLSTDSIDIRLSYPPKSLRPVAIHQDELQSRLDGEPICTVDNERGELIYQASFFKPLAGIELPLITIEWEALAPDAAAQILPTIGNTPTRAALGGRSVTEGLIGANNTLMGAHARIEALPGNGRARGTGNGFGVVTEAAFGGRTPARVETQLPLLGLGFPDQTPLQLPQLWIHQPESGMLKSGEWVVIDLGIENPDKRVFDEIRLAGRFDPQAVEFADTDRANGISDGLNLLDGPFRRLWGWDLLRENWIDAQKGIFYYRMGTANVHEMPSGTVARLIGRIKKPVAAPLIRWIGNGAADKNARATPSAVHPSTGVYLFGENLLAPANATTQTQLAAEDLMRRGATYEKANPDTYRF